MHTASIRAKYPFSEGQKKTLQLFLKDNSLSWIKRKKCPCGSARYQKILNRDRHDLKLPLLLCSSCGLIYFGKILDTPSMAKFYNKYFAPLINFKDGRDKQERFRQYKFILPHLLARCLKDKVAILDVGASSGTFLETLAENLKMIGIKPELTAFELDKKWHRPLAQKGITVIQSLKDSPQKYDLIILSHTLEHLPNPVRDLQLLHKLTAKNGILFIAVPGVFNLHNFYHYNLKFFSPFFHLQAFNSVSLSNMAMLAGFYPLEVTEYIMGVFCQRRTNQKPPNFLISHNASRIKTYLKHIEKNQKVWPRQASFSQTPPQPQKDSLTLKRVVYLALKTKQHVLEKLR